ncbi:MAG: hypothetical protein IJT98_08410 [Prevotella sp.]|nr:hypothetical protein [Prevotella sp.]
MRKKLLSLLSLCALWGVAAAQTVSVADVEALPGETVAFSVSLSDGKADTYTAMTLYVQFPETGFTTTGTYSISSSWPGATAVVGDVDATGQAIIPFASANAITGSDVPDLVTISFKVDESVAVGTYDVTLKQTMFEYNTSDKDYASDVTFHVNVNDAIVLDENSTTAPEAKENVNVHVKRTINANEWSTIVLPFAMTEAQVKAAFGDNVELGDFTGYEATEESDEVVSIKVNFETATAIEANHPYIIKVSKDVAEFTVEGVNIAPEENPKVAAVKRTKKQWSEFIGTYVAGFSLAKLLEEDIFPLFVSGGKLWYATSATQPMKAFRGYFDFYDVLSEVENAGSRITLSFGDDTTTGITNIDTEGDGRYYNLQGQPVETPARGAYIHNGKVIIVK